MNKHNEVREFSVSFIPYVWRGTVDQNSGEIVASIKRYGQAWTNHYENITPSSLKRIQSLFIKRCNE